MVEAGSKSTISLGDATAFASRALGSSQIAERLLLLSLREERLRWCCKLLEGDDTEWGLPRSAPAASGRFWRYDPKVDWQGNSARSRFLVGPAVYMIEVVEADLRALLPAAEQSAPLQLQATPKRKSQRKIVASQRDPVSVVVKALWPDGLPETVSTPAAIQELGGALKDRQMRVPSDDTLKRALGRRER